MKVAKLITSLYSISLTNVRIHILFLVHKLAVAV